MNELPPNLSVTPNNYPWNGAYVNSLAPNTKNGDALIRKCLGTMLIMKQNLYLRNIRKH